MVEPARRDIQADVIITEPETEVKWCFDSIEEIVIVYIRNRLRGTVLLPATHYVYVTFCSSVAIIQHSTCAVSCAVMLSVFSDSYTASHLIKPNS